MNKNPSLPFKHKEPEHETGDYHFGGTLYLTKGVNETIPVLEVARIVAYIRGQVKQQNGIDYLQVFENEDEDKLFFIDNLSKTQIESGDYDLEHNYSTLMYAHEY